MKTDRVDIAFFLPELAGGGAQHMLLKLASAFSERGYKVHVVAVKAQGELLASLQGTVPIIDLNCERTLRAIPPLVRYLRKVRPRAIMPTMEHANVAAILATRLAGTGTRCVVLAQTSLGFKAAWLRDRKFDFIRRVIRLTYPWADNIVAVSQGTADDLADTISLPRNRIQVIHTPVVDSSFFLSSEEEIDHPWFVQNEIPVILSVGRLEPRKDPQTLIEAFSIVRKSRKARLVFLGRGPKREELCNLAAKLGVQNDVDMPGFISNPYPYMKKAAVVVLASITEALPSVLVEALACGTPVVATDCPHGPSEILNGGKYGLLVPVGKPDQLAQAIIRVLDGQAFKPTPESWARFTPDSVIPKFASILFPAA